MMNRQLENESNNLYNTIKKEFKDNNIIILNETFSNGNIVINFKGEEEDVNFIKNKYN